MYKVMALVVLIDVKTGIIVEADCTLSTAMSARFVADILAGKSIRSGVGALVQQIDVLYQGSAKKAIITALRMIYDKYAALA